MSSVVSFPSAVVALETPSSTIDERMNALRFIQQYVESGQEISTFTEKIKINQMVLDSVMLILHREDLIPDLRRRQLIRTECFLMLARVLESKTLFGGTQVEQSESSERIDLHTREKQRHEQEESYLNSTVHDPTKDLYHTLSQKKTLKFGGKNDIFKIDPRTIASQDDTAAEDVNGNMNDSDVNSIESLRSSLSAGSMSFKKHDALFSTAIAKTPNKYNLQKGDGRKRNLPRQTVIAGAVLDHEPVGFQGVSPYDVATTDKRIGYQKSRLWVPNTGSGVYSVFVSFLCNISMVTCVLVFSCN